MISVEHATERGHVVRLVWRPAVVILLLAPFFGETLSAATPPLDLILPWNLALMAGLYGSGALICREVARRWRLGLLGLCLLGAAYGVYEEALIDRYWFYPKFWDDAGIGSYSRVWHTNLLLAVHLTAFHIAVSICSSILIVERLFPDHQDRAWAGRRGLGIAAVMLGFLVPLYYGTPPANPGILVLVVAGGLCVLLVVSAFLAPRLRGRPGTIGQEQRVRPVARPIGALMRVLGVAPGLTRCRRRLSGAGGRGPAGIGIGLGSGLRLGLGFTAFSCTAAHFVLVYALPSTGIPWPAGIAVALVPIAAGVLLINRMATGGPYGSDGLRVVTGILTFFVLLDVVVGLGGRYDLIAAAFATALALRRFHTRDRHRQREKLAMPVPGPGHR
jgi:hypothetical protein